MSSWHLLSTYCMPVLTHPAFLWFYEAGLLGAGKRNEARGVRFVQRAHAWPVRRAGGACSSECPEAWASVVTPALEFWCLSLHLAVFLSSCLSRAEAHTLETCDGASCTGNLASPTPMPGRRHYSTFPEALSQSPTGFTHRLTPSTP